MRPREPKRSGRTPVPAPDAGVEQLRFMGIVDSAMDGIVSVDDDQRIVLFNRAAEKIFGFPAAAVLGQPLALLLPEPARGTHGDHVRRFGESGETARTMSALGTVQGRRQDGSLVPLEVSISKLATDGGHLYTAILRDVTQRLQFRRELRGAAERMRQLSRRLVESQELEQRRISAELHDRIGQNLTALALNLRAIASLAPGAAEKLAACLADSQTLLQSTMGAVRGLIAEIRPAALHEYGLLAGLRALAGAFEKRSGIATDIVGDEAARRLPVSTELALYRIAQEALNNVLKHAHAGRVSIRLRPTEEGAELSIADDGQGFEPAAAVPGTHRNWGLLMMHERAEAVGAHLEVDAAPGRGTRVVVTVEPGSSRATPLIPRDPEEWSSRARPWSNSA